MKRLGVLVDDRDYYIPYMEWIFSQNRSLFDISGCIDNSDRFSKSIPDYDSRRCGPSLEELAAVSDLILSLGYWKIIPKNIIDSVPLGILNIHHSYMLKYRGRHCASWALINGEKTHGTTLHYMTEFLDDGPILDSRKVAVLDSDTAYTLFSRCCSEGLQMIKDSLPVALNENIVDKALLPRPDKDYKMYRKKDLSREIPNDLLYDPAGLLRYIRALTYPGAPKPYVVVNDTIVSLSIE